MIFDKKKFAKTRGLKKFDFFFNLIKETNLQVYFAKIAHF